MTTENVFRWMALGLLLSALTIGGYFRRKSEREGGRLKTREGQGLLIVLRGLALVVIAPLFAYFINPAWVAWARFSVAEPVRWGAALVALAMLPLLYWVLASIGTNISPTQGTRHQHQLVTHGPYRYIRHPLYTFGFTFFFALMVLTSLWWLGLMLIPLTILLWRTSIEETRLIETFGDEYRTYMQRTGRFFPKLS